LTSASMGSFSERVSRVPDPPPHTRPARRRPQGRWWRLLW